MYKYPIIIFEGIEASGKTTNIKIAENYLKKKKIKFIKFREPGGSNNSEKLRKMILNTNSSLNNKTDLLLIFASRSENVEKIIKRNINKKVILIDRFTDSTIAYQHYGMGLNLNFIKKINKFIVGSFKNDFTFLSIVNKKNLKKRLISRKYLNKYDKFQLNFFDKVQKGFIKLSKKSKNKYLIIDSNNYPKKIVKDIIENKLKIILNR